MLRSSRLRTKLGARRSTHSQIRTTCHPFVRRWRTTRASRCRLVAIFSFQALAFCFGERLRLQSCPCQKHPSTKTATREAGKTKSGFPGKWKFRRQPVIFAARKSFTSRSSVVAFPAPRMRDISSDRDSPPNVVMCALLSPDHLLGTAVTLSTDLAEQVRYQAAQLLRPPSNALALPRAARNIAQGTLCG